MRAAVITQAMVMRTRVVDDMRVLTRDASVRVAAAIDECDMVGAYHALVTIAHGRAAAEIDTCAR